MHVIGNDGETSYYCSSKCRKNALKLKRDKRRLKWTFAYREEREKTIRKAEEAAKPKVAEEQPAKKGKKK